MTEHEIWNIIQNKISNEALKSYIRYTYEPNIANFLCQSIDAKEHADLFAKLYDEWLEYQKRQMDNVRTYLGVKQM